MEPMNDQCASAALQGPSAQPGAKRAAESDDNAAANLLTPTGLQTTPAAASRKKGKTEKASKTVKQSNSAGHLKTPTAKTTIENHYHPSFGADGKLTGRRYARDPEHDSKTGPKNGCPSHIVVVTPHQQATTTAAAAQTCKLGCDTDAALLLSDSFWSADAAVDEKLLPISHVVVGQMVSSVSRVDSRTSAQCFSRTSLECASLCA